MTTVRSTSYGYDANGNPDRYGVYEMTTRASQTLTWDAENRLATVSGGASFVYDGDGVGVKKTEGNETILYVNRYYEKNTSTGVTTLSYYLGDKLVAQREGTTLRYVHQDSLGGTTVTSTSAGVLESSIRYLLFGGARLATGPLPTEVQFTGQRLDDTGLYYYGARYYDPAIGRFVSPDTIVPGIAGSQAWNRYSYVVNNPLKYKDPSGNRFLLSEEDAGLGYCAGPCGGPSDPALRGYSFGTLAKATAAVTVDVAQAAVQTVTTTVTQVVNTQIPSVNGQIEMATAYQEEARAISKAAGQYAVQQATTQTTAALLEAEGELRVLKLETGGFDAAIEGWEAQPFHQQFAIEAGVVFAGSLVGIEQPWVVAGIGVFELATLFYPEYDDSVQGFLDETIDWYDYQLDVLYDDPWTGY